MRHPCCSPFMRLPSSHFVLPSPAEKELKVLVKQKQDKVEEIKKKTGYYSTRDLLEKYDEALKKGVRSLRHPDHSPLNMLTCSPHIRTA